MLDRWVLSRLDGDDAAVTGALDGYEPLAAADGDRRARRRRLQLVRAPVAAQVLAHGPRRAALRHARRARDAARGARPRRGAARPALPVPRRPPLRGAAATPRADDSVHLVDWPDGRPMRSIDAGLEAQMAVARELVSLGRAARAEAGVKVRQPLAARARLPPRRHRAPPRGIVEDELNVDRIEYSDELSDVLTYELHPNFKTLGPRLGERAQGIRAGARRARSGGRGDARSRPAGRSWSGSATTTWSSAAEDVELRVRAEAGFAISREGAVVVALDLELDDALRRRGVVRELVRQVQELRKERGFEVVRPHRAVARGARARRRRARRRGARGAGRRGARRSRAGRARRTWSSPTGSR